MRDFFSIAAPKDFVYRVARDHPESASYTRNLYNLAGPYLDDDRPQQAANHFHPVWWELYLAASLRALGVELVPRSTRRRRRGGPDLQIATFPFMCAEAVVATGGRGPDAVPEID